MKYIYFFMFLVLVSASIVLESCSQEGDKIVIEPTYESIQTEVFDKHCVACHSGTAASAGLDLQKGRSYDAMLNKTVIYRPQLVVPGNPEKSFLYQRLLGNVNPMPPSGPLNQAYIEAVKVWIQNGAQR